MTNTKQIAVYKNKKALIEFMDDTRYEKKPSAWPHAGMSRIRINAKDYSEGHGDASVDAFYNLSPDEFYRLSNALTAAKDATAADYARCSKYLKRLSELKQSFGHETASGSSEIVEIAKQFAGSKNEIFSEAGQKLMGAIGRLNLTTVNENRILEEKITEAEAELEEIKKARVLYSNVKILNFEKYINPENEKEHRVTMLKVVYYPKLNFPYAFTVANGWGESLVTKQKGVMIKEGSAHYEETINILLDEKALFPMLHRADVFLRAMATHALSEYFEAVVNPPLFYTFAEEEI
ncbi:MAG: hypothetical protein J5659_07845 [Clostridia bacterium]|nr:hypothetical protein [Clostridia bacterium]